MTFEQSSDIDALQAHLIEKLAPALLPYCREHLGSYEVHLMLTRNVGGFPTHVLSFELGIDVPVSRAKQEEGKP